ncbi:MAG: hypothetical protein AB3N16_12710 [Flavobacteriaceae bacterium]
MEKKKLTQSAMNKIFGGARVTDPDEEEDFEKDEKSSLENAKISGKGNVPLICIPKLSDS